MAIDVTPETWTSDFHASLKGWIKCARCTERLGRPYPVEMMGIDGAESSDMADGRYKMVMRARCHGEETRVACEVPSSWPPNLRFQRLAYVYAFVRGPHGLYTAEVRKGNRDPGPFGAANAQVH